MTSSLLASFYVTNYDDVALEKTFPTIMRMQLDVSELMQYLKIGSCFVGNFPLVTLLIVMS